MTSFRQSSLYRLTLSEPRPYITPVATLAVVGVDAATAVGHRGPEVARGCSGPLAVADDALRMRHLCSRTGGVFGPSGIQRRADPSVGRARRQLDPAATDLGVSAPRAAARIVAAALARGA